MGVAVAELSAVGVGAPVSAVSVGCGASFGCRFSGAGWWAGEETSLGGLGLALGPRVSVAPAVGLVISDSGVLELSECSLGWVPSRPSRVAAGGGGARTPGPEALSSPGVSVMPRTSNAMMNATINQSVLARMKPSKTDLGA